MNPIKYLDRGDDADDRANGAYNDGSRTGEPLRAVPANGESIGPAFVPNPLPEFTNPLSQQPGETDRAFAAFCSYCELGAGRNLRLLHQRFVEQGTSADQARSKQEPPTRELSTIFGWSSRHAWQIRVRAFDAAEVLANNAERERVRRQRQERIEAEEWEQGTKLKELADDVLEQSGQFLQTSRRVVPAKYDDNGRQTEPEREIITVRLRAAEGLKAAELGSKLRRMAAGMPTEARKTDYDFKNMSDSQLRALLLQSAEDAKYEVIDPSQVPIDPNID